MFARITIYKAFLNIGLLSLIFAIISLILSIISLKSKNPLVYISLVGSIILIVFEIIMFIISITIVSNTLSDSKKIVYQLYEERLANAAQNYSLKNYYTTGEYITIVTDSELIQNDGFSKNETCDGYALLDTTQTMPNYIGYIKCDNYTTEGFDSSKLNN